MSFCFKRLFFLMVFLIVDYLFWIIYIKYGCLLYWCGVLMCMFVIYKVNCVGVNVIVLN